MLGFNVLNLIIDCIKKITSMFFFYLITSIGKLALNVHVQIQVWMEKARCSREV